MAIVINTRVLNARLTGAQRYVFELLRHFGRDVEVISPRKFVNGVPGHAWEQFALPSKLGGRLLFSPSNTGPLMYENQVVSLLDVVPLDHPEWLNPKFAAWYRFVTPRLAHRVKHVITISEFSKRRIIETTGINESKITVTPLGVDSRFFPQEEVKIKEVLSILKIPSRSYILCLGSLEPRKNLERLLTAWSMIENKIPEDIWLLVAGGHGSKIVFQGAKFNANLPRVLFLGHVDDVFLPALYSGSIAFVYPSVYEGFGLPPLEAMACGAPVLTGNMASLPEVVGDCGITVDPYNCEAIADGIRRLVDDSLLRSSLSIKGIDRAFGFNWVKTAASTLDILKFSDAN